MKDESKQMSENLFESFESRDNVIYTLEFIRNVTCQLIKLIIQKSSIPLITDITFSQINSISVSALIIENILYILAAP